MHKIQITLGVYSLVRTTILFTLLYVCINFQGLAQKKLPIIRATHAKAIILDGDHVTIDWNLEPKLKPDIYYVNIPLKDNKVTLKTDQEKITFRTKYGKSYDFIVLLNGDSCLIRVEAKEAPTTVSLESNNRHPQTIPFTLIGSRIYFQGQVSTHQKVTVQFDLGAGGSCVNKMSSEKLGLSFDRKVMVDNSQGVNEARVSSGNELTMGDLTWRGISLIEVENMKPHEDLIVGNGLFRNKIIEIDYEKRILIIHEQLPVYANEYKKQPVFYDQDRPKFKVDFVHHGKKYSHWFLFDTGRDGTMLIGEDFTSLKKKLGRSE